MPRPSRKTNESKTKKTTKDDASDGSEADQGETFMVESILDKKKKGGVWLYKVKWQDYGEEECTWEPARNLESVKNLIAEFNKTWKKEENPDEEKTEKKEKKRSATSRSPTKKIKTEKNSGVPVANYGHFVFSDVPEKVVKVMQQGDAVIFTIRWRARKDGTVPRDTQMTNIEIRNYDKDLLLDFYERRLKFKGPSESKSATKDSVQKQAEVTESKNEGGLQEEEKQPEEIEKENRPAAETNVEEEEVNGEEKPIEEESENKPQAIEEEEGESVKVLSKDSAEKEGGMEIEDEVEIREEKPDKEEISSENKEQSEQIEQEEQREQEQDQPENEDKIIIQEEVFEISVERKEEGNKQSRPIDNTLEVASIEDIESPKEISDEEKDVFEL